MKHVPEFHEIDMLCRTYSARRMAVENFLLSLDLSMHPQFHHKNLLSDARLYRWSRQTVNAIRAGIKLAYGGRC